jgi:hypothetical protein
LAGVVSAIVPVGVGLRLLNARSAAEDDRVSTLLGDRQRFAAEVGESRGDSDRLRRVDLWAAGRWLTCDDNIAFVPQFRMSVQDTLDWIQSGCDLSPPYAGVSLIETHRRLLEVDDGSRERFWFPLWGPTTDNVTGHVFRAGELVSITLEFWRETHQPPDDRGKVFVAEIPEAELADVLRQMIVALGCDDRT